MSQPYQLLPVFMSMCVFFSVCVHVFEILVSTPYQLLPVFMSMCVFFTVSIHGFCQKCGVCVCVLQNIINMNGFCEQFYLVLF